MRKLTQLELQLGDQSRLQKPAISVFRASQDSPYLSSRTKNGRKVSFACLFISRCLFTRDSYEACLSERFDVTPGLPFLTQALLGPSATNRIHLRGVLFSGALRLITSRERVPNRTAAIFCEFGASVVYERSVSSQR